jgi:2-keto-myo-inositol isomerase
MLGDHIARLTWKYSHDKIPPIDRCLIKIISNRRILQMGEFKICLNTSTIRPASLMDKIRITGEVGYDAIELWSDDLTKYEEENGSLDGVVKALKESGLEVITLIALHGWMDSVGKEYEECLKEARRRMRQAAAVGSPYIIASPPRNVVDLHLGARRYNQLLEIGREYGIKPSMEFLGFVDGVNQIKHAWQVVTEADDPDGTIIMDVFHIYKGGSPLDDLKKIPADKISIFHFNDAPASPPVEQQTDADRVYPGDGVAPLDDMLRIVRESGYQGVISLELFNASYWKQDPKEVARIGLEKTKEALKL